MYFKDTFTCNSHISDFSNIPPSLKKKKVKGVRVQFLRTIIEFYISCAVSSLK